MMFLLDSTATVSELGGLWEIGKGVLLTLTTIGVGWACRTLVEVRDGQRDLKHIVVGVDGKNGLRSKVSALFKRVEDIEDRNSKIDAVTEYEQRQHPGEDRRVGPRRVRDVVREATEQGG